MSYNNAMLAQIAAEMKRIGTEVRETHELLDTDAVVDMLDALKDIVAQYPHTMHNKMASNAIVVASHMFYNDYAYCDEYDELFDQIARDKGYSNSIGDMYDVYVRRMDY